jgi:hypothetical protein
MCPVRVPVPVPVIVRVPVFLRLLVLVPAHVHVQVHATVCVQVRVLIPVSTSFIFDLLRHCTLQLKICKIGLAQTLFANHPDRADSIVVKMLKQVFMLPS